MAAQFNGRNGAETCFLMSLLSFKPCCISLSVSCSWGWDLNTNFILLGKWPKSSLQTLNHINSNRWHLNRMARVLMTRLTTKLTMWIKNELVKLTGKGSFITVYTIYWQWMCWNNISCVFGLCSHLIFSLFTKTCPRQGKFDSCLSEGEARIQVFFSRPAYIYWLHSFLPVSTYRYVAYRQYTYWTHKKLGRKIRIAIPSCAVNKIMESFPSESGSYKGFEYAHWQIVNLYFNHQVCLTFMYCNWHNLYLMVRAGIIILFRVRKLLFGNTLGLLNFLGSGCQMWLQRQTKDKWTLDF